MIIKISKGQQITIPANIREELGLEIDSRIDLEVKDGSIIIKPIDEDLDKVFKKAKNIKPKYGLTPKQMDELNERLFK